MEKIKKLMILGTTILLMYSCQIENKQKTTEIVRKITTHNNQMLQKLGKEIYEKDLETVLKKHESLGITYSQKPKISIMDEFSLACATYDKTKKTIKMNTKLITQDSLDTKFIQRLISHELGHLYTDLHKEKLNAKNWGTYNLSKPWAIAEEEHGMKMVSEGISTYFEYLTHKTPNEETITETLYKSPKKYTIKDFYDIGFLLVKPILDKDFKKGIEKLITNYPNKTEIYNLSKYQTKVLSEL
ncbi:hypothetical protein K9L97_04735 [Candidatus Woesearchaeota archaeon]|nr:hypothetical protein [Candidatus Woesearchaeota archaeon]